MPRTRADTAPRANTKHATGCDRTWMTGERAIHAITSKASKDRHTGYTRNWELEHSNKTNERQHDAKTRRQARHGKERIEPQSLIQKCKSITRCSLTLHELLKVHVINPTVPQASRTHANRTRRIGATGHAMSTHSVLVAWMGRRNIPCTRRPGTPPTRARLARSGYPPERHERRGMNSTRIDDAHQPLDHRSPTDLKSG